MTLFAALIVVLAGGFFAANTGELRTPVVLLWVWTPLAATVTAVVYWRAGNTPSLPLPSRRFWRQLSVAGVLSAVAFTIQTLHEVRDPFAGGEHTSPGMLVGSCAAVATVILALCRLPLGVRTWDEKLRVALDAGTVALAAAVFVLHFNTAPKLAGTTVSRSTLIASVVVILLVLIAVFAVAKVALSGYAYLDRAALRLLAYALLVGALGPLTQSLVSDRPYLAVTQVTVPAVMLLATCAGERQRIAAPVRATAVRETIYRRPFSALAYAAVAAVDALLLSLTFSEQTRNLALVSATAVTLTAIVVYRQVTAFHANRRLLAQLDYSATHDALTGLPNRVLFGGRLRAALATPGDRMLAVALLDLDGFKYVNDTLGHEVGDQLLTVVGQRLASCVRSPDTVARLGGDEFVVILNDTDRSGAAAAADHLIAVLCAPIMVGGHEFTVGASIGIATGRPGDEPSDFLRQADLAMYAAKKLPGSGFEHFVPEMAHQVADTATLAGELPQAIAGDQFFLLYQPIVDLTDGRITGVEALARWAHPDRGTLAPAQFIPLAERTGLIVTLGRWSIRTVCEQIAAWSAEQGRPVPVNVNVSARELRDPDFVTQVDRVLTATGISPTLLTIEITETAALEVGTALPRLRALRNRGIRVALDDFGTGYSTLATLQDCPVDEIKLDRTFTQVPDDAPPAMADAVLRLCQALGLHVVAEGVETRKQAERLRQLGYTRAQGFYFARPMSAEQISETLGNPRPAAEQAAA